MTTLRDGRPTSCVGSAFFFYGGMVPLRRGMGGIHDEGLDTGGRGGSGGSERRAQDALWRVAG